jgi:hypothetical protein
MHSVKKSINNYGIQFQTMDIGNEHHRRLMQRGYYKGNHRILRYKENLGSMVLE